MNRPLAALAALTLLAGLAPAAAGHEVAGRGHGRAAPHRSPVASGDINVAALALASTPAAPRSNVEFVAGRNGFTGGHVVVEGNRLYVGAYGLGFRIFDISEPSNPVEIGGYTPGDRADAVPDAAVFDGRHIAVLNGTRRVSNPFPNDVRTDRSEFLDVTDPANPRLLWTFIGQDDGEAHNGDIDDERRLWFPSGGTGAVPTSAQSPNFTHRGLRIYDLNPVLQDPPQAPRRITGVNPVVLWENSPYRRGRDVGPPWNHTHDVELYNDHPVRQPDGSVALRDILLLAEGDSYDDTSSDPNVGRAGSLFIIDVTDPANPVALLRWMHNRESPGHEHIRYHHEAQFLDGDPSVLFITDEDLHSGCGTGGGITAIRVSPDLTSATELSDWYIPLGTPAAVCSVHVMSSYRNWLFLGSYNAGLQVVDYADPANPVQAGYYIAEGSTAWGAKAHAGLVYVGDMSRGLDVFRFTPDTTALPDLAVSNLEATSTKGTQSATVTATIANHGTASASGAVVRFSADGAVIGEQTLGEVAAGGSATASVSWSLRGVSNGAHTLQAVVDPDGTIAESDDANNTGTRTVDVRGNKVQNGDFEASSNGTSPDNWSSSGSTSYDGHSASAGPGGAWTSDPIAVASGMRLGFSVAATGATPSITLEQLGPTGALLGSLPLGLSDSLTVADGVSSVRVRLAGGLLGTTTFDDVRLWEE